MTQNALALDIKDVKKSYKNVQALKGVSLQIPKGQFFGFLGPNGAGKTTLIQSIVGLCRYDAGQISVFGHDVRNDYRQARSLLGYSPQEVNLNRFFSVEQNLMFQAGYFGSSRKEAKEKSDELLEQFGLFHKRKEKFYQLSGGMQKRCLIAKALVSDPKILILDEPTAGVDVEQRYELWTYLRKLNEKGTTIILTTHYIDEAEALCEQIGIISFGEIREIDTPQALIEKYTQTSCKIQVDNPIPSGFFESFPHEIKVDHDTITSCEKPLGPVVESILQRIIDSPNHRVKDIQTKRGNLEDVFLKVTGLSFSNTNQGQKKSA